MDLWLDQARTFRQEPFAESVQRGETGTSFLKMSRPPCAVLVFKNAGKWLWDVSDLVGLLEAAEAAPTER